MRRNAGARPAPWRLGSGSQEQGDHALALACPRLEQVDHPLISLRGRKQLFREDPADTSRDVGITKSWRVRITVRPLSNER